MKRRAPEDWETYRCQSATCAKEFKAEYVRRFCDRECFVAHQQGAGRFANTPEPAKPLDLDEVTGGLCRTLPGPCRRIDCRHNLDHPIPGLNGAPDVDPGCSLSAVATGGDFTLDQIAHAMGLSRERVRQLEQRALTKLRRREMGRVAA